MITPTAISVAARIEQLSHELAKAIGLPETVPLSFSVNWKEGGRVCEIRLPAPGTLSLEMKQSGMSHDVAGIGDGLQETVARALSGHRMAVMTADAVRERAWHPVSETRQ